VTSPEPTVGVEYRPLSELRRWPRNPKLHDLGAIAASIRRHGFIDPIVLDERSGMMVAGHGRDETLESMKRAGEPAPKRIKVREDGEWLVPCLTGIAFEDESTAEAYIIGSNRLVEMGGWDEEALQAIITTDGFDALGTGLTLSLDGIDAMELDQSGLDPVTPESEGEQGSEGEEEPKAQVVRVGKVKVPLTDQEKRTLIAVIESYEEERGTLAGFWTHLLGA
jgi:hypothetical protein